MSSVSIQIRLSARPQDQRSIETNDTNEKDGPHHPARQQTSEASGETMVKMAVWSLAGIAMSVASQSVRAFSTTPRVASLQSVIYRTTTTRSTTHSISRLYMSSQMPPKPQPAQKKIPITLLSGFLGAGKTTTLQHLLENTEGTKIGVIVNDVASVNIDAKLVSSSNEGVVELQNGCACCSLADELLDSVDTLTKDRQLDAVVVELSGVADPIAVKSTWRDAKEKGHPVTQKADMSQVVTLVDASTFGTDWMTWDRAGDREGWVSPVDECASEKKVPDLLAEQVESADLILVNKVDLAGENVEVAAKLARSLNEKAVLQEVEYGKVSPKLVLQPTLETANVTAETSSDQESNPKTSTDDLGIVNFVYKASRPFNLKKLMQLLNQWPIPIKDTLDLEFIQDAREGDGYDIPVMIPQARRNPFLGVLRSKGFCWFAPTRWTGQETDVWRHDTAMYWSHAGKQFGFTSAGKWWGSISKERMAEILKEDMKEFKRILTEDFVSEEYGDRRQEIVFIGVDLDEKAITSALDDCLVTEKGMQRYRQELQNYRNSVFTQPPKARGGLFDVGGIDHIDLD